MERLLPWILYGRKMTSATDGEEIPLPDDQQEVEDDISSPISFKDAVVLNSDWTIETITLQIQKGNINLSPGFQRRDAWDNIRKSRLIESIIVGMPVPNIVLAEDRNHRGTFIVIDGKQRLVSINDFIVNRYPLRGLDIRRDLNGMYFRDLSADDRAYFENSTLRSTVIRNWTDDNFLYTIFYRLNSGSLPLSPQELRRALIGSRLIDAIDNYLSGSAPFKLLFGAVLDRRMRDSELVLRFMSFDKFLVEYHGDFRSFLDRTTMYYENEWEQRQHEALSTFQKLDDSLTLSRHVFAGLAFRKWNGIYYERVINRAVFDCVSRYFSEPVVATAAKGNEQNIVSAFREVSLNALFVNSIERTTKSVQSTFLRMEIWGKALASCLNLQFDRDTFTIS